ncbi:MAG: hypothetical protein ACYCYN_09470, partial [Solirubrobacteraceae bacterium]
ERERGAGDCGEGDRGAGDCGEGDRGAGDCGAGDCGRTDRQELVEAGADLSFHRPTAGTSAAAKGYLHRLG